MSFTTVRRASTQSDDFVFIAPVPEMSFVRELPRVNEIFLDDCHVVR